ncbi:MAG: TIGR04442 family protein [Acidobacteriota bacterium]|jgi:uncharacterized protein (TIGR04442 family)
MLRDIRLHGTIADNVDYYANLAGGKLLTTHFYESEQTDRGERVSFFLMGHYFKLNMEGVSFSGTGGAVSEYMFGSPMPLNDLGHKEVRNRLLFFGAHQGSGGELAFSPHVAGFQGYEDLFLNGNALCNYFFLVYAPWPFSVRRTQEELLKLLGRLLKRSSRPGASDDAGLSSEILRELAEPEATLLLLRLTHKPHERFHDFVVRQYARNGEWGEEEEHLAAKLADEIGVQQYQRKRIAIDILYKDPRNRPIVDEYKDILLQAVERPPDEAMLARLNALRNLAIRHNLPLSLFDTLDGLLPVSRRAAAGKVSSHLSGMREVLEGLFLSSKPPREVIGPKEVTRLLRIKQQAIQHHELVGFEEILLETGRFLDERTAETGDTEAFEVFSELITVFDRLDNAEAVVSQVAFMQNASVTEEKLRSLLGNKRAFDALEPRLFYQLIVAPVLKNPYALRFGKEKVEALNAGLERAENGERTLTEIAGDIARLTRRESLHQRLYEGIRQRLRRFYFNLSNARHVVILRQEVTGALTKEWQGAIPEEAFQKALVQVQQETEYLNNLLPRILESGEESLRDRFLEDTGLDRYHLEELEREYREAGREGALGRPEASGNSSEASL